MPPPPSRVAPGPGQESVWDYPRPPRVEDVTRRIRVIAAGGIVLADTVRAVRVLETSHPPVYYVPPGDIDFSHLVQNRRQTFCEYKGRAAYYDGIDLSAGGGLIRDLAWSYPTPTSAFAGLAAHLAFYPSKAECFVDDERVIAQPGDFYGGWITHELVGPFKGSPGTMGW